MGSVVVQYILLRTDLALSLGASAAQVAHASVAAIWTSRESASTLSYLGSLESMTKIILRCDDEVSLRSTAASLAAAGVSHHVWVEQPENTPTALATAPLPRDDLKPFFSSFKLLR